MSNPAVTLYAHGTGPNPFKIAMLLTELDVEYMVVMMEFGDGPNGVKNPAFLKINPNGRVPAIVDHANNDKVVWESGAILLYLIERYDKEGKFGGKDLDEKTEVWEWLMLQLTGLGPAHGQVNWFKHYHPVKPENMEPSVIPRYENEVYRIYGVLEERLQKTGGDYLALGRLTIVDFSFYPWLHQADFGGLEISRYPRVEAYYKKLQTLDGVAKAYAKLAEVAKAGH